jgi:hypothetical protein
MGIILFIGGIILFIVGILSLFRSIRWIHVKTWRAILEIVIGALIIIFAILSFFQ